MIVEMVAYKTIHQVSEDNWRCMICPDQKKFTLKKIMGHLVDYHQLDEEHLAHHHTGEIFKEVPEIDEDDAEIVLELENEEEYVKRN